jgi:glycosyltransferase involved in cell wall biosynthesis
MIAAIVVATLLGLLGVSQIAVVVILRRFARQHTVSGSEEVGNESPFEPTVTVVVSLRGADPRLEQSLRRLLNQDFGPYHLQVVVDHPSDPSWSLVQRLAREVGSSRMRVQEIQEHSMECGLKCSALVQAIQTLEDSVEVVVFVDADVVVSTSWLRTLVQPLRNPEIGLVTGAQWFAPSDHGLGSWVRSVWNSGASVPTILLNHPWAGSCAIRSEDLIRSGLVEQWKSSIIDDGPMAAAITQLGLRLKFVSNAWMVNREGCSLQFATHYIRRMLTWSRLYEPTYGLTVLHAVMTTGCMSAGLFMGVIGMVRGAWHEALIAGSGLLLFWGLSGLGYLGIGALVRQSARRRGEELDSITPWALLLLLVSLPLTYWIYLWAAVTALWVRTVKWRGIEYQLLSKSQVKMTRYLPYQAESKRAGQSI